MDASQVCEEVLAVSPEGKLSPTANRDAGVTSESVLGNWWHVIGDARCILVPMSGPIGSR